MSVMGKEELGEHTPTPTPHPILEQFFSSFAFSSQPNLVCSWVRYNYGASHGDGFLASVIRWEKMFSEKPPPGPVSRDLEVVAAAALRVELDSDLQLLAELVQRPSAGLQALGQFLNLGL